MFARAFSVLQLPVLLAAHRREPYLDRTQVDAIGRALVRYLAEERDLRGYVPDKGWAHAVAHAADAVEVWVRCEETGSDGVLAAIEALRAVACRTDHGFVHGEDERIVVALYAATLRGMLDEQVWIGWVRGFEQLVMPVEGMPQRLVVRNNAAGVLRAFYFRLLWKELLPGVREAIAETLRSINLFDY